MRPGRGLETDRAKWPDARWERPVGDERSEVSEATREAETEEARAPHDAGPTSPEAEAAADGHQVDEAVREHYREMTELGATEPGEGRIP